MLNDSSEAGGIGSGVLLRALEPMFGNEHMQRTVDPDGAGSPYLSGPRKLNQSET
jgi:3-methyladenine DNA glycosylase Mpg